VSSAHLQGVRLVIGATGRDCRLLDGRLLSSSVLLRPSMSTMSWSNMHPTFISSFLLAYFAASSKAQTISLPTIDNDGTVFPTENEVLWRTISSAIHLLGTYLFLGSFSHFHSLPLAPLRTCQLLPRPPSSDSFPLISVLTYLLGSSILAYCIARRTDKLSARGGCMTALAPGMRLSHQFLTATCRLDLDPRRTPPRHPRLCR